MIKVTGWFSFLHLVLMLMQAQCSKSGVYALCANSSNKTYFRDRERFLYYRSEDEQLQNIEDHTTVIFCEKVVTQQKVIQIANKTNIALYGLTGSHTEVYCQGNESGYRFTNVTNLTLSNISLIKLIVEV